MTLSPSPKRETYMQKKLKSYHEEVCSSFGHDSLNWKPKLTALESAVQKAKEEAASAG